LEESAHADVRFRIFFTMTDLEIHRLTELRSLLESFAAARAAVHAAERPEHLDALRSTLRQIDKANRRRDYPSFRAADYELHNAIVALADVPLLRDVWLTVWNSLQDFHKKACEEWFPDAQTLAEEHEHLVETIALGDSAAAEDAASSHIEAVWFRRAEQSGQSTGQNDDPLRRATAHIAFRMRSPLRLSEIARRVAFTSPGNLSRLFRRHYGIGFQNYLQRIRLEKAAELLRTTRLPVTRIARRVGYRDLSRFGQHFKRWQGNSPMKYRQAFTMRG
jgi:AraC-like DNA-binding protein